MKYRLIAIDMDGTLLNSDNEVSERNKAAIKDASDKGIHVVITTGRVFVSAKYYARILGLKTPIIACNGAYIRDLDSGNILFEDFIRNEDCKSLVKAAEEDGMYYHLYDDYNFYTKELRHTSMKYYKWNENQAPEDRININLSSDLPEKIESNNINIYKMVVIDDDIVKLNKFRKKISQNKNIEIVSSWSNNIEIMNRGISKGSGLNHLCQIMNIRKGQVIAIGDNYNDASMFKFAGLSVAMGNGENEVKKMADVITDTNDKDGVAKVIEEVVLS
ncbi:Cof-type HAD-IIB family hydrolase [Proteiniborus sp.]|uniref:Cof-type HAD-IIB family hydrolase n=1 Tax=Proteiniborus sp. TaxID=2079015 RepID=UPI00332B679E